MVRGEPLSTLERLSPEVAGRHGHSLVPAGAVVFAKSGMSATRGLIYRLVQPAYVVNHLAVIVPGQELDSGYLEHCLRVYSPVRLIRDEAYPSIRLSDIANMRVPLPPMIDQRRVAEVLDKANVVLRKRNAAIACLQAASDVLFREEFGDPLASGRGWPVARLGDLVRVRRGGSPRPIESYLGGDVNWIKIGDATEGSSIFIDRCSDTIKREGLKKTVFLKAGSLIVANSGVSLGFARILRIDGAIHDGWLALDEIDEDKLHKVFLLKLVNSLTQHLRSIAPAGTQPNLNTDLVKSLRIAVPPIGLQRAFADHVLRLESLRNSQLASLRSIETLVGSLRGDAFAGQL